MNEWRPIEVREIGPGSQPAEDRLDYLPLPQAMHHYRAPLLPEAEELGNVDDALALLDAVACALAAGATAAFPAAALSPEGGRFLDQVLGEGEVSIRVEAAADGEEIRIQEAVLAGVWRVRRQDAAGIVRADSVEVGALPACARPHWSPARLNATCEASPELQNAPAVLRELALRLEAYTPGAAAEVVNLTLLPLTDADLALLGSRLGVGPVTVLSRGYGNCRIGSTALPNCWWIKYYNSQDALILNTIEVVDVPAVALAAPEDLADSAERLREILALYRDEERAS